MLENIVSHIASPDRLNASLIALVLVTAIGMLTGPASGNANPFLWVFLDKLCGGLVRKSYNVDRTVASLQFRGALLLTLYLLLMGSIAAVALLVRAHFHLGGYIDPILLSLTLSGGATWSALIKLDHALRKDEKVSKGSFYQVAVSTRSNLNSTDDHGIVRVGVGFVAASFDKGCVAPLFWYLLGGLPAAYLYCGIAAARWSLSKDGFAKGIGTLALKLEQAFGFLPQVLSALLLMLAALMTPAAALSRAALGLFRQGAKTPYAEGGLPLTAVAWGLNVSLGGPVEDVDGSTLKRSWVGPPSSTARLGRTDLRRAIYLSMMAYVLVGASVVLGIFLWKILAQ